jgi:hypothetical protein
LILTPASIPVVRDTSGLARVTAETPPRLSN